MLLIPLLGWALPASQASALVVVNNGANNLIGSSVPDSVFVRDLGCSDTTEVLPCGTTVSPTELSLAAGGDVSGAMIVLDRSSVSLEGGRVSGPVVAHQDAAIHVTTGQADSVIVGRDRATLEISGGTLDSLVSVHDASTLRIEGGTMAGIAVFGDATAIVLSGTISGTIQAQSSAPVVVAGGDVGGFDCHSRCILAGGALNGLTRVRKNAEAVLVGSGFHLDGAPVAPGFVGATEGHLTGTAPGGGSIDTFLVREGVLELVPPADADADGVDDRADNCVSFGNPGQRDTDSDLVGNGCDCDFDQDGFCSIADFNLFLPAFVTTMDSGLGTDMNEDGAVGIADFTLFLPGFQLGRPGDSGQGERSPRVVPDVDGDGTVSAADAAFVTACVPLGTTAPCDVADADRDGDVDSQDVAVVNQHLGIRVDIAGDLFPVGIGPIAPFDQVDLQLGPPLPTPGGSFQWKAASPDSDLRSAAGAVSWQTPNGRIVATPVRQNGARRVDLQSGRPIRGDARPGASCPSGGESVCWSMGAPESANPESFDALCVEGVSALDPAACSLDVLRVLAVPVGGPLPVSSTVTTITSGQNAPSVPAPTGAFLNGNAFFAGLGGLTAETFAQLALQPFVETTSIPPGLVPGLTCAPCPTPLVSINVDPADGGTALVADFPLATQADITAAGPFGQAFLNTGVDAFLTDEQEALFGCGPFYGPRCDVLGFDLFRSEADAVLDAIDGSGPSRCSRAGTRLPGCRGPSDAGFDVALDGSSGSKVSPFSGTPFRAETSMVAWNFAQFLATFGVDFDPDDPFTASGGCTLADPVSCSGARSLASYTARTLADDPNEPSSRRWLWEIGAEYVITTATGALAPYLGYTLHALGPEDPRVPGNDAGVAWALRAPPGTPTPVGTPFLVRYPGADAIPGTADDPFRGLAYGLKP